jgi:hypothetical protein
VNIEEQELSDAIWAAIVEFDRDRPRAKQTENFVVGLSELGFCSERTRRMLAGIIPEPTDSLAALIGTAVGDYVEQAVQAMWPHAIRHAEVTAMLVSHQRVYNLTGHPDLIIPGEALVIDVKTTRGLETVRRSGPSTQQQYQRHGYALGAWEAGLLGEVPLDEVMVANVWLDRAADDAGCHVQMEPYSPAVLAEAADWLDEVVYAYLNEGVARKEPPRNMCEMVCGHFNTCRALDTDVEGLIADGPTLSAIEMYQEGLALERDGARLKDQAKPHLKGVSGSTGEYLLRWIHVNESLIPERVQKGYDRISFSRLKKEQT